jgi:hypothetical protein
MSTKARKGPIAPSRKAQVAEAERLPTPAERREALDKSIEDGAFAKGPPNRLVHKHPEDTVAACRRVIDWFAHIEEPFHSDELEAAKADVFHTVVDALEHAERVLSLYRSTRSEGAEAVSP